MTATEGYPDRIPETKFIPPKTPAEHRESARRNIAYILVAVYVALVITNVALPVVLFVTNRPQGPFLMSDLKDLSSTISSIMAGLLGILGFVVGYYFKSIEDDKLDITQGDS